MQRSAIDADHQHCLSGAKLRGDDFDAGAIAEWYEAEKEAYADLGAKDAARYTYGYHALNRRHVFRHVEDRNFDHALGFGSAWAEEFAPIAARVRQLTVVDPSKVFVRPEVHGIPTRYVPPETSGDLPFEDGTFDLVTCFGALHHVPNVSHVVGEFRRCLQPDGIALIREPIVSMGDWRRPRSGLTPNERGIPLELFRDLARAAGFRVDRESLCVFPLLPRLWNALGRSAYNDRIAVTLDAWMCRALRWNMRYHADTPLQKIRPTSAFLVLSPDPGGRR